MKYVAIDQWGCTLRFAAANIADVGAALAAAINASRTSGPGALVRPLGTETKNGKIVKVGFDVGGRQFEVFRRIGRMS